MVPPLGVRRAGEEVGGEYHREGGPERPGAGPGPESMTGRGQRAPLRVTACGAEALRQVPGGSEGGSGSSRISLARWRLLQLAAPRGVARASPRRVLRFPALEQRGWFGAPILAAPLSLEPRSAMLKTP